MNEIFNLIKNSSYSEVSVSFNNENEEEVRYSIEELNRNNIIDILKDNYSNFVVRKRELFKDIVANFDSDYYKWLENKKEKELNEKQAKEHKAKLEVLKLELETNKLTYESTIRDLKEENDRLININQKFQKYKNFKDFLLWFGVPIGFVVSHFDVFGNLLSLLLLLLSKRPQ